MLVSVVFVETLPVVQSAPALVAEHIGTVLAEPAAPAPAVCAASAIDSVHRHVGQRRWCTLLLRQKKRCGVTLGDLCSDSRDVAASHSRLLLRQQGRCGVTLSCCCCGSRDVAASHSQTAVAAAETLRRHAQRSLSGSKDVAASHSQAAISAAVALKRHVRGLRLRQQRCCGVTFGDLCSGSRDVAASHSQRHYDQSDTSEAYRGLGTEQPASCLSDGCSSPRLQC